MMRGYLRLAVVGAGLLLASTANAQQPQGNTPYATQPVYTAPPPSSGGGEYVPPVQQQQAQQQPQMVYVQQQPGLTGPKELPYDEGDPVPPGYHPDTRMRRGLIIGGAVTFGVFYLISALVGAIALDCNSLITSCSNSLGVLLIPGAGPFVALGTAKPDGVGAFALVVDGVAQAGGLLMLVLGIAVPRSVLVRNDIATGKKITVGSIEPILGPQSGLKITF
jgi:hypothetical protein